MNPFSADYDGWRLVYDIASTTKAAVSPMVPMTVLAISLFVAMIFIQILVGAFARRHDGGEHYFENHS